MRPQPYPWHYPRYGYNAGSAFRGARQARRDLEHYRSRTLELPPGYSIEPMHADSGDGHQMLLLRRADGSPVVAFEFSALSPGPGRIHEIAAEDAKKVAAQETGARSRDETTQP